MSRLRRVGELCVNRSFAQFAIATNQTSLSNAKSGKNRKAEEKKILKFSSYICI